MNLHSRVFALHVQQHHIRIHRICVGAIPYPIRIHRIAIRLRVRFACVHSCELRGTIVIATILHPLPLRASRSRWHSYHLSSSMFDRRDTAKSTYIALQLQASEKSSNSSQEELTSVMRFAHNPACALVTDPRRPRPFAFGR